jgi:hypothetical protein
MRSINAGTLSLLFKTTSLRVIVFLPTITALSFFSCARQGVQNNKQKKAGMKYFMPASY